MSKKMNYELVLDLTTRIGNSQKELQDLQSYLNKLKVPQSMEEGFRKSFGTAQKELEKVQGTLNKKTKTKGDVLGVERSFEKIDSEMTKILNRMQKLGSKGEIFPKKMLQTTEITKLQNRLSDLTKDLATYKTAAKDAFKTAENTFKNTLNRKDTGVKKQVAAPIMKLIDNGEYNKALEKVRNFKEQYEKMQETGTNNAYKTFFSDLEKSLAEITNETRGCNNEIEDLEKEISDLKTSQLEKCNQQFKKAEESLKGVKDTTKETGKATADLTEEQRHYQEQANHLKDQVKYFLSIQNAVMLVRRALTQAFNAVKELDSAMTETAVVTDFTVGDMWDTIPEYTRMANELGVAIQDVYKASTLWYQQGLKTNEVMALTNETLKMARIAGMEAADATDRITAA